jgi:hypothetical protein
LGTPAAEHPSGSYLYPGYEDCAASTSLYIYPLPDHL